MLRAGPRNSAAGPLIVCERAKKRPPGPRSPSTVNATPVNAPAPRAAAVERCTFAAFYRLQRRARPRRTRRPLHRPCAVPSHLGLSGSGERVQARPDRQTSMMRDCGSRNAKRPQQHHRRRPARRRVPTALRCASRNSPTCSATASGPIPTTAPRATPTASLSGNEFHDIGRDAVQVGHATERPRGSQHRFAHRLSGFDAIDVENGATPVGVDTSGNVDHTVYTRQSIRRGERQVH